VPLTLSPARIAVQGVAVVDEVVVSNWSSAGVGKTIRPSLECRLVTAMPAPFVLMPNRGGQTGPAHWSRRCNIPMLCQLCSLRWLILAASQGRHTSLDIVSSGCIPLRPRHCAVPALRCVPRACIRQLELQCAACSCSLIACASSTSSKTAWRRCPLHHSLEWPGPLTSSISRVDTRIETGSLFDSTNRGTAQTLGQLMLQVR
jgi:hypothetical protein